MRSDPADRRAPQRARAARRAAWACLGLLALAGPAHAGGDPELLLEAAPAGGRAAPAFDTAGRGDDRRAMVHEQIAARGVDDTRVLEAMRTVPRHRFVPPELRARAYGDRPLPIGHGQTISQPFIVAHMTELLALESDDRVLEVGTGSGYHAAVLGQIVDHVVTIEIIRALAQSAAERLAALGYDSITVLHGDGYHGYPPAAPFDAIVVTAAAAHVPPPLIEQLRRGGHMAIPVGESAWTQNLLLVDKGPDGEISTRNLMPVRFVPLTGDH